MSKLEEQLLKNLDQFTAFARRRVGDPDLAADLVQDSLLKALKSADALRDNESAVAWFYRILRRTIVDLYRRRDASRRALERLEAGWNEPPTAEEHRTACACVVALLPTLKPEYAKLVAHLDLEGQSPESVAADLGITPNNLRVRHHRARQQLRERLEATCRLCAKHGCLDCHCGESSRH